VGAQTLAESPRLVGGRYELEALVGKGGIGEVWRARHIALNSRVAIKFLQLASAQKESAQRRFTTEAQLTAQLKTPHAVQVFDFGVTEDGQPYLVMELLEGETLGRRLERLKRLKIEDVVRLLGQAARALHRAHALHIVHRDFKPDNIVIAVDDEGLDQVKVLDFGVAKLVGALDEGVELDEAAVSGRPAAAPSFTRTGAVLGTPLYMAPEQVRNPSDVDLKADIWAFGVVAFECLTGRPPFLGSSLVELFERIQACDRPSASFIEPSVPPGFDAWFDMACAPDPTRRFMNASIAWKQLTVALDADRDRSGSFPGLDHHEHSGERRVFVAVGGADGSAATMAGERHELLARTHDDEFHSLRRIPMAALTRPTGPPPAASPPAALQASEMSRPTGHRSWTAPAALGAAIVVGVVGWRVAVRYSGDPAVDSATSNQAAFPAGVPAKDGVTHTALTTTAAGTASAVTAASSEAMLPASAAPPAPSAAHVSARAAVSGSRSSVTVAALAPSSTADPSGAPPPTSTTTEVRNAAPPPTATGALDPGSYR
jgi:eukaryotic-like serine/threonine-protein kinase